jgi:hypothetical protein
VIPWFAIAFFSFAAFIASASLDSASRLKPFSLRRNIPGSNVFIWMGGGLCDGQFVKA